MAFTKFELCGFAFQVNTSSFRPPPWFDLADGLYALGLVQGIKKLHQHHAVGANPGGL